MPALDKQRGKSRHKEGARTSSLKKKAHGASTHRENSRGVHQPRRHKEEKHSITRHAALVAEQGWTAKDAPGLLLLQKLTDILVTVDVSALKCTGTTFARSAREKELNRTILAVMARGKESTPRQMAAAVSEIFLETLTGNKKRAGQKTWCTFEEMAKQTERVREKVKQHWRQVHTLADQSPKSWANIGRRKVGEAVQNAALLGTASLALLALLKLGGNADLLGLSRQTWESAQETLQSVEGPKGHDAVAPHAKPRIDAAREADAAALSSLPVGSLLQVLKAVGFVGGGAMLGSYYMLGGRDSGSEPDEEPPTLAK